MASIQFRSPRSRESWAALDRLQRDMMRAFDRLGTDLPKAENHRQRSIEVKAG
jgi:hypothetical protein